MNKVIFCTTNSAKVSRLKNFLKFSESQDKLEILNLKDLDYEISEPEEDYDDAREIALRKAEHYWNGLKTKLPVITQDDTVTLQLKYKKELKLLSIKDPVIKEFGKFSDKLALEYYVNLVKANKEPIPFFFTYGHGFSDGDVLAGRFSQLHALMVSEPLENEKTENYFLSAIMKVSLDGTYKYYSELTDEEMARIDKPLADSVNTLLRLNKEWNS